MRRCASECTLLQTPGNIRFPPFVSANVALLQTLTTNESLDCKFAWNCPIPKIYNPSRCWEVSHAEVEVALYIVSVSQSPSGPSRFSYVVQWCLRPPCRPLYYPAKDCYRSLPLVSCPDLQDLGGPSECMKNVSMRWACCMQLHAKTVALERVVRSIRSEPSRRARLWQPCSSEEQL